MVLAQSWSYIRWVVLTVFCLFNFSNNLQWITYSTIVDETRSYFDCSAWQVDCLAWLYAMVYVFVAIPCCSLYDRLGLRNGMLIGNALNVAGAAIKLIAVYISPNWYWLFASQLLNSVSACFALGLPPMVAAAWFGTKERSLATSLASVANVLAIAVGFPLPPAVVSAGADASHSTLQSQFATLFSIEFAACAITIVGVVFFVADCPIDAPSVTARRRTEPVPVMKAVKQLLKNKDYVLLMVVMGLANGMFGSITTIMAQVNQPFGISNTETGWIGFVGCFVSIVGSIIIGKVIDGVRKYKFPLLVLNLVITIAMSSVLISFAARSAPLANAYVWYSLMQILNSCVSTVVFEYSVELTYPIPEALSGTTMMILPCLFSVIILLFSSSLLGNNPSASEALAAVAICIGVSAASGLGCLFLTENLRRVDLEVLEGEIEGGKDDGTLSHAINSDMS